MGSTEDDVVLAIAALALRDDPPLSPAEAMALFAEAAGTGVGPGELLASRVPESVLLAALADELDLPFIDLHSQDLTWHASPELTAGLDMDVLKGSWVLPLRNDSGQVIAAMVNPYVHRDGLTYLQNKLGGHIRAALAPAKQIQNKLIQLDAADLPVPAGESGGPSPITMSESPVVEWVDNLFARAFADGASDVHLLHNPDGSLLVRFRVDSLMRVQPYPSRLRGLEPEVIGALLNKCATIDPSDRRRPQDGSFSFDAGNGKRVDARLAMLPQINGPTVVTRLLDPENAKRRLHQLGLSERAETQMAEAMTLTQGLVLMCGPTGSGKTSTQTALLNEVDHLEKAVYTAEEPVEYRIANIGQTNIRADLGDKSLTFDQALKAFMRMDPDVMVMGEIRDEVTAHVAMQAALTGHLVLSTVHAQSSFGAIPRLASVGAEPFAVAEALSLVISQRLIRRLHTCKTVRPVTAAESGFLIRHGLHVPDVVAAPAVNGCTGCAGTGFRGRIAVVDVFAPTPETRELIGTQAPMDQIVDLAKRAGHVSLLEDAYRHVLSHETAVNELLTCLTTGGI